MALISMVCEIGTCGQGRQLTANTRLMYIDLAGGRHEHRTKSLSTVNFFVGIQCHDVRLSPLWVF